MAQPTNRQELVNYCKRQLGAPVLEINVADEQIDDLVDDALQFFHQRHFDGVSQTFLKYQITQQDIDRSRGNVGVATTSTSAIISGSSINFNYSENNNFLQVPPSVIGVNKIFKYEGSNSVSSGMFSLKYQLFLNDLYYWGSVDILSYTMVKTFLEDLDFALNTEKQIRFNQRSDRLYLDIDWSTVTAGNYLIIDCYRVIDPSESPRVWNDLFLKKYLTALIKKQWGQNLIKFNGVRLPGGVELNGRQIYDDAERELETIRETMLSTYELPPFDMIG
jgi:hypothetical protein